MNAQLQTNVTLDTVKYLKAMMEEIKKSVDYAYPKNGFGTGIFYENNAHTALQMVRAKARSVEEFLNALVEEPVAK